MQLSMYIEKGNGLFNKNSEFRKKKVLSPPGRGDHPDPHAGAGGSDRRGGGALPAKPGPTLGPAAHRGDQQSTGHPALPQPGVGHSFFFFFEIPGVGNSDEKNRISRNTQIIC